MNRLTWNFTWLWTTTSCQTKVLMVASLAKLMLIPQLRAKFFDEHARERAFAFGSPYLPTVSAHSFMPTWDFWQWVLVVATFYGVFWAAACWSRKWPGVKNEPKKWTQIENEWWCPGSRTSYACRLYYCFPFLKYWLMWGPAGGNGKPILFIDGGASSNAEYWIGMCT